MAMNAVLFLLFAYFVISFPTSSKINIEEINEKRKEQFNKLFECLNDLITESFKHAIKENKDQKFLSILKDNGESLSEQDKNAIKECRKQILLDSKYNNNYDSIINNKVNLKRNKPSLKK